MDRFIFGNCSKQYSLDGRALAWFRNKCLTPFIFTFLGPDLCSSLILSTGRITGCRGQVHTGCVITECEHFPFSCSPCFVDNDNVLVLLTHNAIFMSATARAKKHEISLMKKVKNLLCIRMQPNQFVLCRVES